MKRLMTLTAGFVMMAFAMIGMAEANTKAKASTVVDIRVDISSQSMNVDVNGWNYGRWKVSTARDGFYTPRGAWKPYVLKKMHYSRKYDNSPMPHSIFFLGGFAIHATGYVKQLGRPASHGCIRLSPQNAARLFSLVQKHGMKATRITITN